MISTHAWKSPVAFFFLSPHTLATPSLNKLQLVMPKSDSSSLSKRFVTWKPSAYATTARLSPSQNDLGACRIGNMTSNG
jgi:hypothetical protein